MDNNKLDKEILKIIHSLKCLMSQKKLNLLLMDDENLKLIESLAKIEMIRI